MERTQAGETIKRVGEKVRLLGWVATRRDHGKIVFIDLRDRSGIVQIVGQEALGELRPEYVVEIFGTVERRPKEMVNPKISTGEVEVKAQSAKIISRAKELPFPIDTQGYDVEEGLRLKYRYLDLRRPRLSANIKLRHKALQSVRAFLSERGFYEIETPYLSKSTPEGARDFIIPARLQPGKFYALPQSPQQYKQLLMVAGFEKYFQLARVFRDEDPRSDRLYGEHTQVDIEMSFTSQDEVLALTEELVIFITEKIVGKKVFKKPFPRFTYHEAMEKFGADKFDLRPDPKDGNICAFAWVVDFPAFEWKETEKRWDAVHHPFTMIKEEHRELLDKGEYEKVLAQQYDLVANGFEVAGGSIRITDPKLQEKIFEVLGHKKEEIKKKFGHLLEAFGYGVPPHGGIALGFDRLMAVWAGETSVREVVAFPTTASGQTSVMDAPSEVELQQLEELGIKIIEKKGKKEYSK